MYGEGILEEDTVNFLAAVAASRLCGSEYRVLMMLKEMNTSASNISATTGIPSARVRQRLKQLVTKGFVREVEVLSDGTKIWGLVEAMAPKDLPTVPTEADIQERKSRIKEVWSEYAAGVNFTADSRAKPDGVGRPRNPATEELIDLSDFKQYEAKAN